MKVGIKKIAQWALLSALCFIGTISFMILAGDEDPMNPIPFGRLLITKALAMAVLAVCVLCGKWLKKKGYLPEYINPIREKE